MKSEKYVKCFDAKAWHDGDCCCNCKNQIELFKHPWNSINKGKVSESTGMYVCIVEHICSDNNKGMIFEQQHGMCELHIRK